MIVSDIALKLKNNIKTVIKGKDEQIDLVIMALLSNGHILLEDVPGTGKTMLARSLAKSLDCDFARIQFTPDLLPSDITGINYFNMKNQEFIFKKGPVITNILLADEINRATPRTQSAMLECMEERQVTVDENTISLNPPFIVIATQNPIETQGTYPLPEAQLDRFLIKLSLGYTDKESEIDVLSGINNTDINSVVTKDEIIKAMELTSNIHVSRAVLGYITDICRYTRESDDIKLGVSMRGSIGIKRMAQANAALNSRDFVTPDDVKKVFPYVISHRLILKTNIMGKDKINNIIGQILTDVPVPTE